MNTIPSIFNERQIKRTVLGGTESPANIQMPVSVIILNREGSRYRSQMLSSLLQNGFESIVSMENSADNYNIEDLAQRFPMVKFIVPLEMVNVGDMINIGMSECSAENVLVIWDNIHITSSIFTQRIAQRISETGNICVAPMLVTPQRQSIPVRMIPAIERASFRVIPSAVTMDKSTTVYPFDFMGLYNKQKFIQLGGFDYTIKAPYWQNLDFSLRAWLWNEKITIMPAFRLQYESEVPREDTTVDESHIRFYLKNLAPRLSNDYAYIPISRFFGFKKKTALGFFEAKAQFGDARKWVEKNKFRFISDAQKFIESWKEFEQ